MPLTPEEQAQLEQLKALRATGAKETEFEGAGVRRRFQAQSLSDIQDLIGQLEAKGQSRPRRALITTSKGFR